MPSFRPSFTALRTLLGQFGAQEDDEDYAFSGDKTEIDGLQEDSLRSTSLISLKGEANLKKLTKDERGLLGVSVAHLNNRLPECDMAISRLIETGHAWGDWEFQGEDLGRERGHGLHGHVRLPQSHVRARGVPDRRRDGHQLRQHSLGKG